MEVAYFWKIYQNVSIWKFTWHAKLLQKVESIARPLQPQLIQPDHSLNSQAANHKTYYSHISSGKVFHTQKTSSSKNSNWLFDTYLCVERCKTQGNFQHFKAAFLTTPWVHTITSPRTPHSHTGLTLNTLRYKLYYNSSTVKRLYWILRAKVSPTRSLCLPLHKATTLSFRVELEDQRAFWTLVPCFRAVRMVAWASSKEDKFY